MVFVSLFLELDLLGQSLHELTQFVVFIFLLSAGFLELFLLLLHLLNVQLELLLNSNVLSHIAFKLN